MAVSWIGIDARDRRALVASTLAFTALLASYYLLRPVRDALGATLGADEIKYLSSAVFVVMLAIVPVFGACVRVLPRPALVPVLYALFAAQLVGFAMLFARAEAAGGNPARVFYVWVTVFNLFAVSVFWSRMADLWEEGEARRYFGLISAGGSLGGILGPLLARRLATGVGIRGLVLLAALLLVASLGALLLVGPRAASERGPATARGEPDARALLAGLALIARTPFLAGIAALVSLGSLVGMIVYVELARQVAAAFPDAASRAAYFSGRDLWVNGGAFVLQLSVIGALTRRLGVGPALIGSALLAVLAFVLLGADPTLGTLTTISVGLRCTEFGLAKPARDMLYTVVPPIARYQSKNVIDTAVYRGSDMLSGWLQALVSRAGWGLTGAAGLATLAAAALVAVAAGVTRGYRRRGGR